MRLYRIIGAGWAGTQGDAKAKSKAANAPWHECEVPTDKPGLLAFLEHRNVAGAEEEPRQLVQLRQPLERDPMDAAAEAPTKDVAGSLEQHLPSGISNDGHPDARPAFTSAQVSASALPRSEKVRDVCYLVSKMNAGELGFVALEVIARGAKLGGVA
jgi:hypothetical protein